MSALADLIALDLRTMLPHRSDFQIGWRPGPPRSITLHFNGPPVADRTRAGELRQLAADAEWQMRPGGLGTRSGGDGLQYHLVILADGAVVLARNLGAVLWHCANPAGNTWSLAVHLPLGGAQDATAAQWAAFGAVADAAIQEFGMGATASGYPDGVGSRRAVVFGHREWSRTDGRAQSPCPGPLLFARLQLWRGELRPPRPYRVDVAEANVRCGPGRAYLAREKLERGTLVTAVSIVTGEEVAGDTHWLALDDGRCMHASVLEALPFIPGPHG
jgi:hypothetical protein